jgi:hypothetical protein
LLTTAGFCDASRGDAQSAINLQDASQPDTALGCALGWENSGSLQRCSVFCFVVLGLFQHNKVVGLSNSATNDMHLPLRRVISL